MCCTVYSPLCHRKLTGLAALPIELAGIIPITRIPAVEKKGFPPVLLRLPRNSRQKRLLFELCFQAAFLDVTGILHAGYVLSRAATVYCMAVGAAPPFQPYSARKTEEVTQYESMSPKPRTSAFGAGSRLFPVEFFSDFFNFPQIQPTKK